MTRPDRPAAVAWLGVLLVTACALMLAMLETLLVPLYAGSVVVPVSVVLAGVGNVALPLLAQQFVARVLAAALPVLAWLVVVLGFGTVTRPEGDVILPGSPAGAEWVTYGMLLVGAVVGAGVLVWRATPPRPDRPGGAGQGGSRPSGPRQGGSGHQGRDGTKPAGGSSR